MYKLAISSGGMLIIVGTLTCKVAFIFTRYSIVSFLPQGNEEAVD